MTFTEDMKLMTTKYMFLANVTNKYNGIDMLSCYLQLEGRVTHHAQGGVDILISHTAQCNPQLPKTILSYPTTQTWSFFCATMQNQMDLIS